MTNLDLTKLRDAITSISANYPNLNDSFKTYAQAIGKLFAESGAERINTAKEDLEKTTGVMIESFEEMVKGLLDALETALAEGEKITK